MALELSEQSDVFRSSLHTCEEALAPLVDWSLESVLRGGEEWLGRVDIVQPALFAVMVALADMWRACGVSPDAVVGHSQGEIAAACVAGGLSLKDAARVVVMRSRALVALAGAGSMVAIAAELGEVEARISAFEGEVSVASVNGPRSIVISGAVGALERLLAECEADGVKARRIPVDYAAHSAQVERIRDELLAGCAVIEPRRGEVPFYSTVTAEPLDTGQLDAGYWYRNLRERVEFQRATARLLGEGYRTFVEVSPHPVLAVGMHETVERELGGRPRASGEEDAPPPGPEQGGELADSVTLLGSLRRGEGGRRRFFASLGEAWVRGVEVDWGRLLDGGGATLVRLPSYPFRRRRYWLDASTGAPSAAIAGQVSVGHPFMGAAVANAENDGWLLTGRISIVEEPWIVDHTAAGAVVVPGTTFVDIALRAGAQVGCELLQDLVHEVPLVLSPERPAARFQVVLGAADELGRRTLGMFSAPEDPEAGSEEPWTRHARGVLAPDSHATPVEEAPLERQVRSLVLAKWPPSGAEAMSVEEVYDYFAGLGLEYGPAFLSIRAVWHRDGEVFTEVRLPEHEHEKAGRFYMHPALLDASLQACAVLMRAEHPAAPEFGVMPFAWTRVRLHSPGAFSVRARVVHTEHGGYSLATFDERGQIVLSAESVVLRRITPAMLRQMHGAGPQSLHRLEWAAAAPETPSGEGSVTATASDTALHACWEMLDEYRLANGEAPLIEPQARVPDVVLACFGVAGSVDGDPPHGSRVVLQRAVSLVRRWIADERLEGSRCVILTRRAVSTGAHEGIGDLLDAPLWGLMRSVQSEHPGRFVLLDLDGAGIDPSAIARALATGEPQAALRAGKLLVPRLRPARDVGAAAAAPAAGRAGADGPSVPQDLDRAVNEIGRCPSGRPGSVLITGGTGLIGAALARHLVSEHGVRSVMLAGRMGPEAPEAETLKADLRGLGAEVGLFACDVSDREQVAKLIASAPREYPLSAVIHAAGVLDDCVIDAMTPAHIDRALAPKLDGAWHLHELTQDLELSAFVLFSAGAGTIGSPGQGNYAAASAFLDALAAYRREQGLPGSSMAWGLWAGGLAGEQTAADAARFEQAGLLALSVEEGLELFDAAYLVGEPLTLPMRVNVGALRARAKSGMLPPLFSAMVGALPLSPAQSAERSLVRRLASTPESERGRVALDLVRAEVAAVLGHSSAEEIDPDRAFNELGFDSLTAIELRNRLIAMSAVQLPATLAFDYPSAQALSEFLLERVALEIDGRPESAPSETDVRGAFASIPLDRLREAGVLDTLMQLAGLAESPQASLEEDAAAQVDELDLASLVELSLGSETAVDEPVGGR